MTGAPTDKALWMMIGGGAVALLGGALEFLDGVAQRLLLERAADRSRHPEAEVDRLRARGPRPRAVLLEAVGAVDRLEIPLDQAPARGVRRLVGVLEHVAHRLERHVERECDPAREPVGMAVEDAALGHRPGPVRVAREVDEHGEALVDGRVHGDAVGLRELGHARADDNGPVADASRT